MHELLNVFLCTDTSTDMSPLIDRWLCLTKAYYCILEGYQIAEVRVQAFSIPFIKSKKNVEARSSQMECPLRSSDRFSCDC